MALEKGAISGAILGSVAGGLVGALVGRHYVPDYVPEVAQPGMTDAQKNAIVVDNAFGPTGVANQRAGYSTSGALTGFVVGLIAGPHILKGWQ